MRVQKSQNRDDFQNVAGYVSAMAKSFPLGTLNPRHAHRRAQLVFAVSGVMELSTAGCHWLIPPQRALWVPAGTEHEMRARTDVELRTLWVRVEDVTVPLPSVPTLVYVTPLLRELIVRAVELPIEDGVAGAAAQIISLIFSELHFVPPGEFHLPRVSDPRLVRVETQFKQNPGDTRGLEEWAAIANMSARTFTRHLKDETGLSFADWRQQIRLTEAMVRLVGGESITSIALSLGYENTGSFSRMFKRAMGVSPSDLAI
ncbi:AraC family transcriptional regulator [Cupriavidus sp. 30B13]|uniref:AraC family transcriptional regulator n=1 Tax=Cupriavidus sp. 30B13 TaxID=3384241 RepID=UPI003B919A0F